MGGRLLAAVLGACGEQILGRTSLDSGLRPGDYVLDLDAQAAEELIQPFIRREAVLSSRIEGTQAVIKDVYLYDVDPRAETDRRIR